MDDGEDTDDGGWGEWDPPLGKELEAAGVGDVLGVVGDGVAGIELFRGEGAEGAALVRIGHWVRHFCPK